MPSLFSRIIAHEIPGTFIFEEERWVSFLDKFPVRPGHALLVPRRETQYLSGLQPTELQELGSYLQRLTRCVKAVCQVPDAVVMLRDGPAAGQIIPHLHWHVVPRPAEDDADDFASGRYGETDSESDRLQADMAGRLAAVWRELA
ncbi:MAG: HIT family protein [Planctomycetota bacterium]